MKYKWISRAAKGFVFLITIAIILLLVIPHITFRNKPSSNITMKQYDDGSESIKWLSDHFKIEESDDQIVPRILLINDSHFLELPDSYEISRNIVVFEALYQKVNESKYLSEKLNYLTGVTSSPYVGKTYQDLSDIESIPIQIMNIYHKNYGEKWPFYGEGIVISSLDDVIVLVKGKDYRGSLTVNSLEIGSETKIPFYGVFEITESESPSLATFNLKTTSKGDEKLEQYHIKNSFPAVYKIKRNYYEGYYLAGQFTKNSTLVTAKYDLIVPMMQRKIIYEKFAEEQIFWQFTIPFFKHIMKNAENDVAIVKSTTSNFSVKDKFIFKKSEAGELHPFFIKGINLGAALPGKFFTEFPQDKATYLNWLNQMEGLHINTIRVYTLLPPSFYQALYEYNQKAREPLYLLQEIWPEENPEDLNYLGEQYNQIYRQEIEYAVHAIHGNIEIPVRDYRAYGLYAYDVSPYLLGYLVGREMEPEEVIETNKLNEGYEFQGQFFYAERNASPTESWLAASCDYALSIESDFYQGNPIIGIVNWPTLDALNHDSEWNEAGYKNLQFNDKVSVDIDRIGVHRERVNGFVGAYHIYPNYPNFMNNEQAYAAYRDGEGVFRYGGYLKAFMNQNHRYPAIVAEYGISTSQITAHYNPDGLDHGGLSEDEQASFIIRMTQAIKAENYSGAIIFEWMDEWAKKTWTTEFYMIPYERQVLWHNVLDPEQNYGLLAIEAKIPEYKEIFKSNSPYLDLDSVASSQNASYIYLKLQFKSKLDLRQGLKVAFDLNVESDEDNHSENSFEYILEVDESPKLRVVPSYNWINGHYKSSVESFDIFENLTQLVNPENTDKDGTFTPALTVDLSQLNIGDLEVPQNNIWIEGQQVTIRIPYGLLGFSDPSSRSILWDSRIFIPNQKDQIETAQIESIGLRIMKDQMRSVDVILPLESWEIPMYDTRLKRGFGAIGEYFKNIEK
ncbi:hypothetical protein [Fusibacter sp. 3D3]|uniref:hypothetical protein n=1 Tax=Fusibacter sp. 3D3 TaxID=1048380 RepID=UPI000852EDDF|nr:hypothetical protein [Fusibacter sp. 3D3]GAU79153.1 hypothetical protein F3D3_3791 [Fusibacter sp. 3D3]